MRLVGELAEAALLVSLRLDDRHRGVLLPLGGLR